MEDKFSQWVEDSLDVDDLEKIPQSYNKIPRDLQQDIVWEDEEGSAIVRITDENRADIIGIALSNFVSRYHRQDEDSLNAQGRCPYCGKRYYTVQDVYDASVWSGLFLAPVHPQCFEKVERPIWSDPAKVARICYRAKDPWVRSNGLKQILSQEVELPEPVIWETVILSLYDEERENVLKGIELARRHKVVAVIEDIQNILEEERGYYKIVLECVLALGELDPYGSRDHILAALAWKPSFYDPLSEYAHCRDVNDIVEEIWVAVAYELGRTSKGDFWDIKILDALRNLPVYLNEYGQLIGMKVQTIAERELRAVGIRTGQFSF